MKIVVMLLALANFISCSTKNGSENWDSGAQKQEAIQEEGHTQQSEKTRNQFPDPTEILNRSQPF